MKNVKGRLNRFLATQTELFVTLAIKLRKVSKFFKFINKKMFLFVENSHPQPKNCLLIELSRLKYHAAKSSIVV